MYKPIIDKEYISLKNLYIFTTEVFKKHKRIFIFFIFLTSINFFISSPRYAASVSFYTDYTEGGTSNTFGDVLTRIATGDSNDLNFSIENFLFSENFYKKVIYNEYEINGEYKNLIEIWEIDGDVSFLSKFKLIPSLNKSDLQYMIAKEKFEGIINFSEDQESGLNNIIIVINDYPELAVQISKSVYEAIKNYFGDITSIKAKEKISFIKGRLDLVSINLKQHESEMLNFLENNKVLSSPHLVLKRSRIQRDIDVNNNIFISLSNQLELAKIEEKNNVSPIFTLDEPFLLSKKYNTSLIKSLLSNIIFLFIIFGIKEAVLNRKHLFNFQ